MSPEASVVAFVVAQLADLQNNKLRDNKPPLSQLWTGAADADSAHQRLVLIRTSYISSFTHIQPTKGGSSQSHTAEIYLANSA